MIYRVTHIWNNFDICITKILKSTIKLIVLLIYKWVVALVRDKMLDKKHILLPIYVPFIDLVQ